jgi:UDP-GlcNAc:undecaprenyl-phosphate GlcNAc-1-phosphate transferase
MNGSLVNRPLFYRKLLILVSQTLLLALTYYCAFLLHLNFNVEPGPWHIFVTSLPLIVGLKLVVFYRFGLMRGWWRYSGMSDLLDLTQAATVSAILIYCASRLAFVLTPYSRTLIILDFAFTILIMGGARFAVRAYTEAVERVAAGKRTIIVGVSPAGRALARELQQNPELNYELVGFIDDDVRKHELRINGIRVLGSTEDLPDLIHHHDVARVIIALPLCGRQTGGAGDLRLPRLQRGVQDSALHQ